MRYRRPSKAIAPRDGGCIFPGCTMPVTWCDIHHVEHWQDLGPTDLVLLAALCRNHHRVTHRKDWTKQPTHNGWFTWTTPSGLTLTSRRHRPDTQRTTTQRTTTQRTNT